MQLLPERIDGPVAVIGDVHGQLDKLQTILSKLRGSPGFAERWIVFIGDFVDRGPDPKGVIDLVLELQQTHGRVTAVCGNHELAMCGSLHLFPPPEYADWDKRWAGHYDAHTTFESYGAPFGDMPALLEAVPTSHREFLAALPWCVEHPDYLFVHAGLEAHQPYEMQVGILRSRDYTLTRPPWLCSKSLTDSAVPDDCPVTVVSGHVRMDQVIFADRRLLVDTTGGHGGDLSCVLLPENIVVTSGDQSATRPAPVPASRERKWWQFW